MSTVKHVNHVPHLRVQEVHLATGEVTWTVVDALYQPIEPIHRWMRHLHRQGRSPNTLRSYSTALLVFWLWCLEQGIDWQKLTLEQLGQYAHYLQFPSAHQIPGVPRIGQVARERKDATVRNYLAPIYGLYTFHIVVQGLEAPFPLWSSSQASGSWKSDVLALGAQHKSRPMSRPISKKIPKTLSVEQCQAIVNHQRHLRDKLLFALLATTGIRIGTALGLRHEDFRSWDQTLAPRHRVNANQARHKKSVGYEDDPSDKLLTSAVIRLHAEYLHNEYGDLDSDYLFVNLWGGKIGAPMRYGNVDDLVQSTRRALGFHFTPHMFRHTFATLHLEAGVQADRVAIMLDHRSEATTTDIYGHVSARQLRKDMEAAGVITGRLGAVGEL